MKTSKINYQLDILFGYIFLLLIPALIIKLHLSYNYAIFLQIIVGLLICYVYFKQIKKVVFTKNYLKWSIFGLLGLIATQFANVAVIKVPSNNTTHLLDLLNRYPIIVILIVFILPAVEEIVFRAIIFGSLFKINSVLAYTFTALAFWAIHGDANGLPYVLSSLVLSLCFQKTKSIVPGILAHQSLNLLIFILQ